MTPVEEITWIHPEIKKFWGPQIIIWLFDDDLIKAATYTGSEEMPDLGITFATINRHTHQILYYYNGNEYNEEEMLRVFNLLSFT